MTERSDVERQFHRAMVSIYERARDETGYLATRFLQMVSEIGGLEAARRLVESATPSDGFTALWERRRLNLTVEALVLHPEFDALFTSTQRQTARSRLASYGYTPQDDD